MSVVGGPRWGNAFSLNFDGTDDYIIATPSGLGITSAISISAWIKTPVSWGGGPNPRIGTVIAEDNLDGNSNWVLWYRGGSFATFAIQIWNTNGDQNLLYSTVLGANDGNWHHIAATYDGTSNTNALKIYIDNVVTEGTTTGTGVQNFARATTIGGSRYKPPLAVLRYFRDYIDEVAVWDSELTATQISNIYNNGKPNDLSNLSPLLWYRFQEGSGTTAIDSGTGGNDGTIVNGATHSTDVP